THGHHHHHHASASGGGQQVATSDDSTSGDSDSAAPSSDSADTLLTLLQNLQTNDPLINSSAGGTPSSTNGNSGQVDLTAIFAQLFASFPNGTGVDVRA